MKDVELYSGFRKFGWKAYEQGRIPAARKAADYFLGQNEDDGDANQLLGLVSYAEAEFQKSVAALETASLIQPLRLASQVCLALGYAQIGRRSLALDLLRDLASKEDMPIALTVEIATGLNLVDRPDLALRTIQKVIRQDQSHAQAWYDFGYYIGLCGGCDTEVEKTARRAIALDSKNSRYRIGLAGLLYRHNRMEEAIEVIECLSEKAILAIDCICCLQKVVELYRRADDGFRTLAAIRQLKKLHRQKSS
ncbi:MAG: tetratricopeptide repeat protein [Fuerstiella sp.]